MNDWFEAEQRVERAQQLSESHRWEEALRELEAALDINPHHASWHAQHGLLLDELGRTADAAEAYEKSLELEPGDEDVATALGDALYRLGRYAKALSVFDELARILPDYEPAYCHRIAVYTELGRHDQAEEMFYLAQELEPNCPHCFYNVGVSLAARGLTDRALFCWQRVLDLEPKYENVRVRIAQAYRLQGKLDEALEYLLEERREDPGNIDLLYELAELAEDANDIPAAIARYGEITELEPEQAEAHFARGRLLLQSDGAAEALECFKTALAVGDPDELNGFNQRVGEAYLALERFALAANYLRRAVSEEPDQSDIRTELGNALLMMDKISEAADQYRRVLAIDPRNAMARQHLAICHFKMENYEAGLHQCLEVLKLSPNNVPAMYRAVLANACLGRWRDARAMLQRAMRQAPDDEVLKNLRARLWRYRLVHPFRQIGKAMRRLFG